MTKPEPSMAERMVDGFESAVLDADEVFGRRRYVEGRRLLVEYVERMERCIESGCGDVRLKDMRAACERWLEGK